MTKNSDSPLELSFDDDTPTAPVPTSTPPLPSPDLQELGSPDDEGVKIYEIKSVPAGDQQHVLEDIEEEITLPPSFDDPSLTLGQEIESSPLLSKSYVTLTLEEDDELEKSLSESLKTDDGSKKTAVAETTPTSLAAESPHAELSQTSTESVASVSTQGIAENTYSTGAAATSTVADTQVLHAPTEAAAVNSNASFIPPATTPKKAKKKISPSTLIFIGSVVFGTIVVIAINIILFQPRLITEQPPAAVAAVPVEKTLPSAPVIMDKPTQPVKKLAYSGSQDNENQHLEFEGIIDQENLNLSFKVTVTTPKPEPLTLEQVGRHEVTPIWIKKIDTDRILISMSDMKEGEPSKPLNVPLRIYYENESERSRLVTEGTMTVTKYADRIEFNVDVPSDAQILRTPLSLAISKTISF